MFKAVQQLSDLKPRLVAVWEVLADYGWIPLSSTNTDLLEPEYHSHNPASVTIKVRGTQYLVDVAAMTQKSPSTNAVRPLRRLGGCEWGCLTGQGWVPYDAGLRQGRLPPPRAGLRRLGWCGSGGIGRRRSGGRDDSGREVRGGRGEDAADQQAVRLPARGPPLIASPPTRGDGGTTSVR